MADSFQSSKVTASEQSSASKFNNFVQAVEDAMNSLDNTNIDAAAAIGVSKLAAGGEGQALTIASGIPTWTSAAASTLPAGIIVPYGGTSAPATWLLCDGALVSRTTYATLYAAVGTSYGVGDGSTTFGLPDLRGRLVVGKGSHVDVDTLGDNDGVAEASRRPKHSHTVNSHGHEIGGGAYGGTGTSPHDKQQTNASPGTDSQGPSYLVVNYIVKT